MLLQVLMCLLVGNLVMVWNLVWFLDWDPVWVLSWNLVWFLDWDTVWVLSWNLVWFLDWDLVWPLVWNQIWRLISVEQTGNLVLFCPYLYYIRTLTFCMGSITVQHLYIYCTSVELRNRGGITRHWKAVILATWGGPWWLSSSRLSIWPSNNNVPWSMSSSDLSLCTSTSNPSNGCHMDLFGIPLVPIFNLTGPTTKPFMESCRLVVDSVNISTYWGLCRPSLFDPGSWPPAAI